MDDRAGSESCVAILFCYAVQSEDDLADGTVVVVAVLRSMMTGEEVYDYRSDSGDA